MTGAAFGLAPALVRCPDCDSHVQLVETHPGVIYAAVHHDPTCPTWKAKQR